MPEEFGSVNRIMYMIIHSQGRYSLIHPNLVKASGKVALALHALTDTVIWLPQSCIRTTKVYSCDKLHILLLHYRLPYQGVDHRDELPY